MKAFRIPAAVLWCAGAAARAQYPDRPLALIVPAPPGGGADTVAQPVAEAMSGDLK